MEELDTVLSRMRDEYSPDADAKQRVRAAMAASLAVGTLVGSTQLAAGTAATAGRGVVSHLSRWVWAKVATGLVGTVGLGGVALTQLQQEGSDVPQDSSRNGVAAGALAASAFNGPSPVVIPLPVPLAASPAPVVELEKMAQPSPKRVHSVAAPLAEIQTRPSPVLEELRLIREASQALRAGQAQEAERLLAEHRRRFPQTALSNEQRGLSLLASCAKADSASLRAAAERYIQAAPASPLAEHVKKQCLR